MSKYLAVLFLATLSVLSACHKSPRAGVPGKSASPEEIARYSLNLLNAELNTLSGFYLSQKEDCAKADQDCRFSAKGLEDFRVKLSLANKAFMSAVQVVEIYKSTPSADNRKAMEDAVAKAQEAVAGAKPGANPIILLRRGGLRLHTRVCAVNGPIAMYLDGRRRLIEPGDCWPQKE